MTRPGPEVGQIILFDYLWAREDAGGAVDGRKNRPCAVVVSVTKPDDGQPWVVLAPITHSAPALGEEAVSLPISARAGTGLDDQPSWLVLTEANYVAWSDSGMRPARNGDWVLGWLPRRLAIQAVDRIKARLRERALRLVIRS